MVQASGLGAKGEDDNCFFEFDTALLQRGRGKLISVVLEPQCKDTFRWSAGVVQGKLGSKLYVNLSDDEDQPGFQAGIEQLLQELATVTGRTFATGGGTASASSDGADAQAAAASDDPTAASPEAAAMVTKGVDDETGDGALRLLIELSKAEPLRVALDSDQLLDALEFLIEREKDTRREQAIELLINVFAANLGVDSSEGGGNPALERDRRVLDLLSKHAAHDLVLNRLTRGVSNIYVGNDQIAMRSALITARRMAASQVLDERRPFQPTLTPPHLLTPSPTFSHLLTPSRAFTQVLAERLVDAGLGRKLVHVLTTTREGRYPSTDADLALAADVVWCYAFHAKLRPRLKEAGLERALRESTSQVTPPSVTACTPSP